MTTINRQPASCAVVHAPCAELDLATAASLQAVLSAAHRPGAVVVLDMEGVSFLDSSALHVVLAAKARLDADGGALLLTHVAGPVLRTLQVSGVARRLIGRP